MHRRITMVLEFNTPDKYMRKIIWDNLLGKQKSLSAEHPQWFTPLLDELLS